SGVSAPAVVEPKRGRTLPIVLGVLVVALAAAIALVVVDPFGEEPASVGTTPHVPAPSAPVPPVAADPIVEPEVEQAPAPVLRSVLVELDSRPPGAMVRIGESEYGPTPAQVELTGAQAEPGAELTFVFSMAGHREMTVVRAVPAD